MDFRFQAADAVPPKGLALILWTVDGLTLKRLACSSALNALLSAAGVLGNLDDGVGTCHAFRGQVAPCNVS
jgi:hypothetical protein